MPTIERFETDEAPAPRLTAVREVLHRAFGGDFTDDDWRHSLGGLHVVVRGDDGTVLGHAAVVPRTIVVGDRPFRAGYVEGVGTEPARQGEGLGSRAMAAITDAVRERFDLGVLSTSAHAFYERLGWERWRGPTYVRSGEKLVRTEDEDDGIMVLRFGPSAGVDLTASITCESRDGDDW